jgi:predicted dehydrogenase
VVDLRIGVSGFGIRGPLAILAHQPGRGSSVTTVCDPNDQSLHDAREAFGPDCRTTSQFADLLVSDLDAVFVTSPDHLHETQACALLEAGIPVFLEKPMATTLQGADRILEAAARNGTRLYVGHNMRHMPFVVAMKEIIDRGDIGEVKSVWVRHFVGHGGEMFFQDWHAERANITSLLLQKAAHDLDIIHWFAGGYSRLVNAFGSLSVYGDVPADRLDRGEGLRRRPARAWFEDQEDTALWPTWPPTALQGRNPKADVEDLMMMQMVLDNGVLAAYQQCDFTPDYWRSYVVIGTEGRVENFGDGDPGTQVRVWRSRKRGWDGESDQVIAIPKRPGGHHGADQSMVPEFLRYVRDGVEPTTSPVSARWAVAAGSCATESMRNGGVPITVPDIPVTPATRGLPAGTATP